MREATPFQAVPFVQPARHHGSRLSPVGTCRGCKTLGATRVVQHPSGPVVVCMECGAAQSQVERGWATRAFAVVGR